MAESREEAPWSQFHTEQIRMASIVAGLQRDMGDLTTEMALSTAILRGGDGGAALTVRMALNEQKIVDMRSDLTDHRRTVEGQMERIQTTLEQVRSNSDQQIRDAAQQRTNQLVQIVGWILGIIAMLASTVVSLLKH